MFSAGFAVVAVSELFVRLYKTEIEEIFQFIVLSETKKTSGATTKKPLPPRSGTWSLSSVLCWWLQVNVPAEVCSVVLGLWLCRPTEYRIIKKFHAKRKEIHFGHLWPCLVVVVAIPHIVTVHCKDYLEWFIDCLVGFPMTFSCIFCSYLFLGKLCMWWTRD